MDVRTSSLERQIDNLTSLICQLVAGKAQQTKICRICTAVEHPTNMCPLLQKESCDQMNASCDFSGPPQWQNDPYSNMNNSRWWDHHNFSYGNPYVHSPHNFKFLMLPAVQSVISSSSATGPIF